MPHSETFFSFEQEQIFYRHWPADSNPTGVIVLVHGMAEHSGRYQHLAKFLNQHHYAVYALDLIGHGQSTGPRGHLNRFSDFTSLLDAFVTLVSDAYPELPRILLGHSMGGLISASYLLENQAAFQGCVLSGPFIKASEQPPKAVLLLIRLIAKLMPRLGMLQLAAEGISRDPAVVKTYRDDPLVFTGKVTSSMLAQLFNAQRHLLAQAHRIELPLLIMHGNEDKLAAAAGSQQLIDTVASVDKQLIIYDQLFHEIFNEPEQQRVFTDLLGWLQQRGPQQ